MKLLKSILVAIDFDDARESIVDAAARLAKRFESEIVLAHVIEPAERGDHPVERLEAAVVSRLEELRSRLSAAGVRTGEVLCLHGRAHTEILSAADQVAASVIVIGTRGVATGHHFLLGTTTEKVIRRSHLPTLAVPPSGPVLCDRIVCPVDFSDASARGLENAIQLARTFQGTLHVVTVMPPPSRYHRLDRSWAQWAVAAEAVVATECAREFDEFLRGFDFQDVKWEKHIERGDAAREITELARSTQADMIVMGSTGRTGVPYAILGSTAVKVARTLPCALLTIHREQLLTAEIEQNISDIRAAFDEGQELLRQGFCREALTRFQQCRRLDPHFVHAIEAEAGALERLGRPDDARQRRELAQTVRRELWEQQVTASVRAHHPFFQRRNPY